MLEITTSQLMALCGGLCGFVLGAVARSARFCTFGAIEDLILSGQKRRFLTWTFAIAISLTLVQVLHVSGIARIDQTFYLSTDFGWSGAIFGGFIFGLGMALVGTCSFGALVRLGGGDLKSLVTVIVLGLSAYMTARGLTALFRVNLLEALNLDLAFAGGQGIPHILGYVFSLNADSLWLPIALGVSGVLLVWCLTDKDFLSSRKDIASGLIFGVIIMAGFLATGLLGNNPFEPQRVHSLSYVLPPGETILYLATFTGSSINFGIGSVFGTVLGAAFVSLLKKEFRVEAYDDAREMSRHLVGAFFMGFGGVTALGCTIGQGLSGMATLSLSAPLALAGIFAGAVIGLHYLLTGHVGEALILTYRKLFSQ